MEKHLKYIDGTSDKFWQIKTQTNHFVVIYGRNGTSGTSQTKTFDSEEICLKEAEKLVNEKIKKGYSENGTVSTAIVSKVSTVKQSAQQEIIQEWKDIVAKSKLKDLVPFLKEKSKGNIEALKKEVKKAKSHYMTYVDLGLSGSYSHQNPTWGYRGSETQKRIIQLSALALYNKDEARGFTDLLQLLNNDSDKLVLEILEWFRPEWINDFLLTLAQRNSWQVVPYETLLLFEDKEIITFQPELYALSLVHFHENTYRISEKSIQHLKFISESERTIKRDIPELFNYQTEISNTKSWNREDKNPIDNYWHRHFIYLLEHRLIDKIWLIEQSLLIQTKEWNNNIKAFFRKTIDHANPVTEDWLKVQQLIFPMFHSTTNSVVSYAIDTCKKIFEQTDFDTSAFLDWVEPVLMKVDAKGSIKTLLLMFEKIMKSKPEFQSKIMQIATDVLTIPDMDLQQRVIKLLNKYKDKSDDLVKEKITLYLPLLQGNTAQMLAHFIDGDEITVSFDNIDSEKYNYEPKSSLYLLDENRVQLPESWNDILFLFGKFISSNEVIDSEILLNVFIAQKHLFPQDYLEQLKPYLRQLEGYFESYYFNHIRAFLAYKIRGNELTYKGVASSYEYSKMTKIALRQIDKVEYKIQYQSTIPMLSLPTHYPHWVAPKTLVERLIAYKNHDEPISLVDLSIAISRMPLENVQEAIQLSYELNDELGKLMRFALGETDTFELNEQNFFSKLFSTEGGDSQATISNSLWAVAARTRYPTGVFKQFEKTYLKDVPNVVAPFKPDITFKECWNEWTHWQTKVVERTPSWQELNFKLPKQKDIPDILLYSLDLFDKGSNRYSYYFYNNLDIHYVHSLTPQNDEALNLMVLRMSCYLAGGADNALKPYLEVMQTPEFKFSENACWTLGCCLFQEKKEVRFMAGEVLIQAIQEQKIDINLLGQKIGYLMSNNYGPINRFIESISMAKDISNIYNDALFQLLDTALAHFEMKDKAPTNFKKMIELFFDLKVKTNNSLNPHTQLLFETLRENTSLKSILKQILI